jgi:pimeloyl-ACP methyl ester carboxylesterase
MALTFVLIHGSWMGGEAWDGVASFLRAAGHTVHAPTLAGHGPDASRPVTHSQIIEKLAGEIVAANWRDFVLVGHSFGGTIIQQLAQVMPERIRRLVFWNAFVVPDGQSLNDQVPPHFAAMFAQLAAASADGSALLPYPLYRDAFFNDGTPELAQSTYAALFPEYLALFDEKLTTARFFALQVPKSYLYSWDDASLPHGEATGWYPRFGNRLGLFRYVSMPGGHMAHWTRPEELAAKLIEAGRD